MFTCCVCIANLFITFKVKNRPSRTLHLLAAEQVTKNRTLTSPESFETFRYYAQYLRQFAKKKRRKYHKIGTPYGKLAQILKPQEDSIKSWDARHPKDLPSIQAEEFREELGEECIFEEPQAPNEPQIPEELSILEEVLDEPPAFI